MVGSDLENEFIEWQEEVPVLIFFFYAAMVIIEVASWSVPGQKMLRNPTFNVPFTTVSMEISEFSYLYDFWFHLPSKPNEETKVGSFSVASRMQTSIFN